MKKKQSKEKLTPLQRFGLFFYDRLEIATLYWLAVLIFGIASYTTLMRREGFPSVDVPVSVISGTYFAGDAKKVDAEVVQPASEIISRLPEVDTVQATSAENFFTIVIEYKEGTSSTEGSRSSEQALVSSEVVPSAALLEFKPIDAAKFTEQSDILIALYSSSISDQEELQKRAQAIAEQLTNTAPIERAKAIPLFIEGTNPNTGSPEKQQDSFDRIGLHEDGADSVKFYPSATIAITAQKGTDQLELYDAVQKRITDLQNDESNKDIELHVAASFAEGIRAQVSSLQENLFAGLIVVIIVSFLLISLRGGISIAIAMVTTLLATVGTLYATGNSLNTITLFALILSLGLIVDDATIVVEAIDAGRAQSKSKREIVKHALKRVARASTAGTITTMLAFAPMLFISGVLGSFIRVLPITIIISLSFSLLVSLSIVPFLSPWLILGNKRKNGRQRGPVARAELFVSELLERNILAAKKNKRQAWLRGSLAIGFALVVVFASGSFFSKLKFDIFPNTKDSDRLALSIRYTPGTNIEQAQVIADRVNQKVANTIGDSIERISYQSSGNQNSAVINIDLKSYKEREITSPTMVQQLKDALKDEREARIVVAQVDAGPPRDDLPFSVQIRSENEATGLAAAAAIRDFLQNRELIRTNNTTFTVTKTDASNPFLVTRQDNERYFSVSAGYDADDVSALVTATQDAVEKEFSAEKLRELGLNEDALVFDFGNESDNQESFDAMLIAFPLLLIAMYFLMAFQFKSFLQPLLIFVAIPFSFFGVAAGLNATDNPLSFFVMVGFFALIGIAVNNSILLTDYANQAKDEGADRYAAIAGAIRKRFRPLIATSLTAVVALIPLALSDPFWESLSYTLIFGLLSSTLLVVIAFPWLYLVTEKIRDFGHALWLRKLPKVVQIVGDIVILPIRIVKAVFDIGFRK